jgi:hypothetical protein
MIFGKRALLALGIACAACPFSHASKGGKSPPNSSKAHKESTPYFVASATCAQKCISAEFEPDNHLLTNAIQHCDAQSSRQMWDIVSDGTFVKVKSVAASADSTGDYCLGVVPQEAGGLGMKLIMSGNVGAGDLMVGSMLADQMAFENTMEMEKDASLAAASGSVSAMFTDMILSNPAFRTANPLELNGDAWIEYDMCSGKLGLVPCDNPRAQWSSTDGQLISPFCWGIGYSSFLSVNEGCTDLQLSTTTDGATAISRAETFMAVTQEFVETIPPPPAPTYYPTSYMPTTATYTPTI